MLPVNTTLPAKKKPPVAAPVSPTPTTTPQPSPTPMPTSTTPTTQKAAPTPMPLGPQGTGKIAPTYPTGVKDMYTGPVNAPAAEAKEETAPGSSSIDDDLAKSHAAIADMQKLAEGQAAEDWKKQKGMLEQQGAYRAARAAAAGGRMGGGMGTAYQSGARQGQIATQGALNEGSLAHNREVRNMQMQLLGEKLGLNNMGTQEKWRQDAEGRKNDRSDYEYERDAGDRDHDDIVSLATTENDPELLKAVTTASTPEEAQKILDEYLDKKSTQADLDADERASKGTGIQFNGSDTWVDDSSSTEYQVKTTDGKSVVAALNRQEVDKRLSEAGLSGLPADQKNKVIAYMAHVKATTGKLPGAGEIAQYVEDQDPAKQQKAEAYVQKTLSNIIPGA